MEKSGWLNINKPENITSTRVVSIVKRIMKVSRVGHGGTLDPFASGVLPISINKATKTTEYVMDHNKSYLFHLTFGIETDTFDIDGEVIQKNDIIPQEKDIIEIIPNFIGKINQMPPKYSALKINGKRACDIMREGGSIEMQPRGIEIFSIKYNGFINKNTIELIVDCGRGTYIRSLGIDIAKELNSIGVVSKLQRLRVGEFKIENSINLDDLEKINIEDCIIDIDNVLNFQKIIINDNELVQLRNGVSIDVIDRFDIFDKAINSDEIYKIYSENGKLFCLGKLINHKLKSILLM